MSCKDGQTHDASCELWPHDPRSLGGRGGGTLGVAAGSVSAAVDLAASTGASSANFEAMSVAELRNVCRVQRVDVSSCVEKGDMIQALVCAGIRPPSSSSGVVVPRAAPVVAGVDWEQKSVAELRRECRWRGVDISTCVEKPELVRRLGLWSAGTEPCKEVGIAPCAEAEPEGFAALGELSACLRTAAASGDAVAFSALLSDLDDGVVDAFALEQVDGNGRTFLHVCGANAGRLGVADVARLLVRHSARADLLDFVGQTPLSLAVATAVATLEQGALDTIRALLTAKPTPKAIDEWQSADCALARASVTVVGRSIVDSLHTSGLKLPWYASPPRLAPKAKSVDGIRCTRDTCPYLRHSWMDFSGFCCHCCRVGSKSETHGPVCERLIFASEQAVAAAPGQHLEKSPFGFDVDDGEVQTPGLPLNTEVEQEGPDERCGPLIIPTSEVEDAEDSTVSTCSDDAEEIDMEEAWRAARISSDLGIAQQPKESHELEATCQIELLEAQEAPEAVAKPTLPRKPLSLRAAVKMGDVQAAQEALRKLGDGITTALEGADGLGRTVLHCCAAHAALAGSAGMAQLLLEHLACADARDSEGRTPLALAISVALDTVDAYFDAALQTCRSLLAVEPSLESCKGLHSDQCAMATASADSKGSVVAKLLLESGVDLPWHQESVRSRVAAGDVDGVSLALQRLQRNAGVVISTADRHSRPLLHLCSASSHDASGAAQIVQSLVASWADVGAKDASGRLALAIAVDVVLDAPPGIAGGLEVVQMLISCRAEVQQVQEWQSGECMLAQSEPDCAVIDFLLRSGAELPWHRRSLYASVRASDPQAVRDALCRLGSSAESVICNIETGFSLLHLCAKTALREGSSDVALSLLECSAKVCIDLPDFATGLPALGLAVSQGLLASSSEAERAHALSTALTLLVAGASVSSIEDWRSSSGQLARALATGFGEAMADLLLDFGADLPWHPQSVQSGVKALTPDVVSCALEKLRNRATLVINIAGSSGHTLLHACGDFACDGNAAVVAQTLLSYRADASARDSLGQTPVALAVFSALSCSEPQQPCAIDTIRTLLSAGDPCETVPELQSSSCLLARSCRSEIGQLLAAVLMEFGVELPWYIPMTQLGRQCLEHNIPLDIVGPAVAEHLLRETARWRSLAVKGLRQECQTIGVQTDDCVEKGDLVSRLLWAQVEQAKDDVENPDGKLLGKWCYGNKPTEYVIRQSGDDLCFCGPHSHYGTLTGVLRLGSDGWLEGRLLTISGEEMGQIRLRYTDEDLTVVSHFKSATMPDWGRQLRARKATARKLEAQEAPVVETQEVLWQANCAPTSTPSSAAALRVAACAEKLAAEVSAAGLVARVPIGPLLASAAGSSAPEGAAAVETEEASMQEAAILAENIETTDDLPVVFMAAVAQGSTDAVRKGLARVRQAQCGSEDGEDDAEALVCTFDADGNTMLHHCAASVAVLAQGGAQVAAVEIAMALLEAKADVNEPNLLGETPLLATVRVPEAPLALVQALLEAGAVPGHGDTLTGETALMEAACRGDVALCILLLQSGADASQKNSHGLTARDLAAENGHKRITNLLRAACPAGVREHVVEASKPLWVAVRVGDVGMVQGILEELGGSVEEAMLMTTGIRGGGHTLLHVCALNAPMDFAEDVARILIENMARLDIEDVSGRRPLELAVTSCLACAEDEIFSAIGTLRVLLASGASAIAGEWADPASALAKAADSQRGVAICRMLRAFGADLPWLDDASVPTPHEEPVEAEGGGLSVDLSARCEKEGVPLESLGSVLAESVLRECATWWALSSKDLRIECKSKDLPTDDYVEKGDFVRRLRQVRVWEVMTCDTLQAECLKLGIPMAFDFATRETLEDALRQHYGFPTRGEAHTRVECEARGIPVSKVGLEQAKEILGAARQLEASKVAELKEVYKRWGLELEGGLEKQDMVRNLTTIFVWQCLPLEELHRVCLEKKFAIDRSSREELLVKLVDATWPTTSESRYKKFFDYRSSPSSGSNPQSQQQQQHSQWQQSGSQPQGDWDWETRAAWNRSQFHSGSRDHPGMPTGSRKWAPNIGGSAYNSAFDPRQEQQWPPPPPRRLLPNVDSYFQTLGLPPSASHNEVRKAYRKLALKYHPDKNPGSSREAAEKVFREVQHAYDKVCEFLREKGMVQT